MTEKQLKAYDMFEEFVKYCETNNVIPQYIMMRYGTDQFWGTFDYFKKFHKDNVDTD